jgi:hypothetical protein
VLLDAGHGQPPLVLLIHPLRLRIHQAVHGVIAMCHPVAIFILRRIASQARSSAGAPALAFVVARKSIATGESTPALGADMGPLSRMEFRVSLEIVQSPEARLASLTDVWLLLAVGKKVAFQIVMPRELGGAIRAAMLLRPGGSLPSLAVAGGWKAEAPSRVIQAGRRHWVGKGFVAGFLGEVCFISMAGTVSILRV